MSLFLKAFFLSQSCTRPRWYTLVIQFARCSMAHGQFLVRNRHNNTWYGRVTIPRSLRPLFNDRREIRQSLATTDKKRAKRLSRLFWVQCQAGFESLQQQTSPDVPFAKSSAFVEWLAQNNNIGPHRDDRTPPSGPNLTATDSRTQRSIRRKKQAARNQNLRHNLVFRVGQY